MSVAALLGVSDPDQGLLAQARACWARWCEASSTLAVVDDLLELPGWIRVNDPATADKVLVELARLASPTGGDDVVAAAALSWLLLPGAASLAHRMRQSCYRIDELVASHLWMEVREFAWQRLGKVAANVLAAVRRAVLRDLDAGSARDQTWARTVVLDPDQHVWDVLVREPVVVGAREELADVLDRAVGQRVIEERDRVLLSSVAEVSDDGLRGVCSRRVSVAVAARHGVSPATVRRRVRGSLAALATTYQRVPA